MSGIRGPRRIEQDEYDKLAELERLPLLFEKLENEIDEDEEESEDEEEE